MAAPIDLRNDFDSVSLRRLAKRTRDATQSRRLLAGSHSRTSSATGTPGKLGFERVGDDIVNGGVKPGHVAEQKWATLVR